MSTYMVNTTEFFNSILKLLLFESLQTKHYNILICMEIRKYFYRLCGHIPQSKIKNKKKFIWPHPLMQISFMFTWYRYFRFLPAGPSTTLGLCDRPLSGISAVCLDGPTDKNPKDWDQANLEAMKLVSISEYVCTELFLKLGIHSQSL